MRCRIRHERLPGSSDRPSLASAVFHTQATRRTHWIIALRWLLAALCFFLAAVAASVFIS
jgi:hypothetical protein